jgi:murein DD-endopeptidase MepM/ murein hydrolase activator NlpD
MTFTYRGIAPRSRSSWRVTRWVSALVALSILVAGSIVGPSSAAFATNYPSYADVQAARSSEAAKQAEIATLNQLLTSLQDDVTSTQAVAVQKGLDAQVAQSNYDDAISKADKLKSRADAAKAKADQSKERAGELAARLARTGGGGDLSATLFFSGAGSRSLLAGLGLASMVKDLSAGIYTKAVQDQNVARSLADQADLAREALKALSVQAQKALDDAAAAAQAASAALADQQSHQIELNAQLALLVSATNQTEAAYAAGVEVARQAALAAARAAAAATSNAGTVSAAGWARPSAGHISSPYGYRIDPYTGIYALHEGTDLAPGCGSPIYAAHSGTVILAGPYGGYGNYVRIRNSDNGSYWTAYGHIVNGGILVHIGQTVQVGQNIARVGSTGMSTGCHLHFEVYHNGATIDPVPFMRAHGVELAN